MVSHQFCEVSHRGVRADPSTPLCITSLTLMADLRRLFDECSFGPSSLRSIILRTRPALNLVRRQQQTCLGIRNSLDKPDALQRLVEGLEALDAKFDDNVPATVGGVQRLNFRDPAQ